LSAAGGAQAPELLLSTSPFVYEAATTPAIMREVLIAALAVTLAACWHFGVGALLLVAAASAGALGTEWLLTRSEQPSRLGDWSAATTGVLLGLTLPPGFPLWMAFLGGVVGIGLGKLVWGGLGQNLFNPALVGRAFLQAAFPTAITTWSPPVEAGAWLAVPRTQLALPLMRGELDGVSAATPLGLAKFEHQLTDLGPLFLGHTAGSLGETSAALLLLCGVWLGVRRIFDWRLPLATASSVALLSGALFLVRPESFPPPQFMLLSGGLCFAAVFMVTDPVTTPTTPRGAWIFGLGVGALVVLIRLFGGLAEGVMYAILLMNALTPHINRHTQPRPFGG
jgi:electron transport complex protein RnfD